MNDVSFTSKTIEGHTNIRLGIITVWLMVLDDGIITPFQLNSHRYSHLQNLLRPFLVLTPFVFVIPCTLQYQVTTIDFGREYLLTSHYQYHQFHTKIRHVTSEIGFLPVTIDPQYSTLID
jgi:hypothetical protein